MNRSLFQIFPVTWYSIQINWYYITCTCFHVQSFFIFINGLLNQNFIYFVRHCDHCLTEIISNQSFLFDALGIKKSLVPIHMTKPIFRLTLDFLSLSCYYFHFCMKYISKLRWMLKKVLLTVPPHIISGRKWEPGKKSTKINILTLVCSFLFTFCPWQQIQCIDFDLFKMLIQCTCAARNLT